MHPTHAPMDEALDFLAPYGPDLANGLTNHAPMAAEALCAMGRGDAVLPWLERYRSGLMPSPPARARIEGAGWRDALGQTDRTTDWFLFFRNELAEARWRDVLKEWAARLAPGLCGSATHGIIRVGHAARSLDAGESPARVRELADALGYLAANYQELPGAHGGVPGHLRPATAIGRVPIVPPERRRFTGTITSSLEGLDQEPAFAPVADLIGVEADPEELVSELTETFARVYLANAHDVLTTIVFVHGVTSAAALRSLLPHLDPETRRRALRFGWQAGCGLYATFASRPPGPAPEPPREAPETLVDMAVAHGDEHAIKLTEACLREWRHAPSPAYLAAARHALDLLPRL